MAARMPADVRWEKSRKSSRSGSAPPSRPGKSRGRSTTAMRPGIGASGKGAGADRWAEEAGGSEAALPMSLACAQGGRGLDAGGPEGGEEGSEAGCRHEEEDRAEKGRRVAGGDSEEEARQQAAEGQGGGEPGGDPREDGEE